MNEQEIKENIDYALAQNPKFKYLLWSVLIVSLGIGVTVLLLVLSLLIAAFKYLLA